MLVEFQSPSLPPGYSRPPGHQSTIETDCPICHTTVRLGETIFPVSSTPEGTFHFPQVQKDRRRWVHIECARRLNGGTLPPDPICKHWANKGRCNFGAACLYAHPIEVAERVVREAEEEGRRREAVRRDKGEASNEYTKKLNRGPGKRSRVSTRGRFTFLRVLIQQKFGSERIRQGSGVLDVAGGKGWLAFEMLNLLGVPATVLDPRPLDLHYPRRKLRAGFFHRNTTMRPYVLRDHETALREGALTPGSLRMFLSPEVVTAVGCVVRARRRAFGVKEEGEEGEGAESDPAASLASLAAAESAALDAIRASFQRAAGIRWTERGLKAGGHEAGCCCCEMEEEEEGEGEEGETGMGGLEADMDAASVGDSLASGMTDMDLGEGGGAGSEAAEEPDAASLRSALDTLLGAALVVGCHPDQAAEPLVDLAIALGVPFAVVPCCVYACDFPHRRLPDGTHVRTYGQLIRYLQGKAEGILAVDLPFDGPHRCLFWDPKGDGGAEVGPEADAMPGPDP